MKVLCFLPDALNFQNKLGMITRSAGVGFQPCENDSKVYVFAEKETESNFFLFTDIRNSTLISDFSIKYPKCKIVVIMFEQINYQPLTFLHNKNIESFVATKSGEFDAIELITLLKKFDTKKTLDLENYLSFPAIFNEKIIKNSSDKKNALTLLEGFIIKISGISTRTTKYSQRICDLADEILLNFIFEENQRLKTHPRNQPFELNEKEEIKIKWGFDGEVFGLLISDPFGTLSKNSVLQFLYGKNKSKIHTVGNNFELAVQLIYERLHHYIVHVKNGEKSEIICLLRFDKRFIDFDNRLRSFHFFDLKD